MHHSKVGGKKYHGMRRVRINMREKKIAEERRQEKEWGRGLSEGKREDSERRGEGRGEGRTRRNGGK